MINVLYKAIKPKHVKVEFHLPTTSSTEQGEARGQTPRGEEESNC